MSGALLLTARIVAGYQAADSTRRERTRPP